MPHGLENRASNLLPDDQRRKAFEKAKDKYSNSLLGGVPLSSTHFSTHEFQVAVQSMSSVGLTCLIPFFECTLKSRASTADKRVDVYSMVTALNNL